MHHVYSAMISLPIQCNPLFILQEFFKPLVVLWQLIEFCSNLLDVFPPKIFSLVLMYHSNTILSEEEKNVLMLKWKDDHDTFIHL